MGVQLCVNRMKRSDLKAASHTLSRDHTFLLSQEFWFGYTVMDTVSVQKDLLVFCRSEVSRMESFTVKCDQGVWIGKHFKTRYLMSAEQCVLMMSVDVHQSLLRNIDSLVQKP